MPRGWVLAHIERAAADVLDLADYWEYRRLLELSELLDLALTQQLVPLGLRRSDPDVREAAEDFRAKDD